MFLDTLIEELNKMKKICEIKGINKENGFEITKIGTNGNDYDSKLNSDIKLENHNFKKENENDAKVEICKNRRFFQKKLNLFLI